MGEFSLMKPDKFDYFVSRIAPVIDVDFDRILTKKELREGIDGNFVPETVT